MLNSIKGRLDDRANYNTAQPREQIITDMSLYCSLLSLGYNIMQIVNKYQNEEITKEGLSDQLNNYQNRYNNFVEVYKKKKYDGEIFSLKMDSIAMPLHIQIPKEQVIGSK